MLSRVTSILRHSSLLPRVTSFPLASPPSPYLQQRVFGVFEQQQHAQQQRRTFFTVIQQYQKGVALTLGKLTAVKEPGIRIRIPLFQSIYKVDLRTTVQELSKQEVITRDNVSISVDAVVYYKVVDAEKMVMSVKNIHQVVHDLAQIKVREMLSHSEINEILHNREKFSADILSGVKDTATSWGISVENISLKDIKFDEGMVRAMAKRAEADRLREAKLIHAESEVQTAHKLLDAAQTLEKSALAIRLRELDTLQQIAKEPSHSSIIIPMNVLDSVGSALKKVTQQQQH